MPALLVEIIHQLQLPRFIEEEFLVRVIGAISSAQLSLFPLSGLSLANRRAKLQRLYEKFIKSVNFFPWFHEHRERAQAQIRTPSTCP